MSLAPKGIGELHAGGGYISATFNDDGTDTYGYGGGFFGFYCSFRRRQDYDGHCSQDGVEVEEILWERALSTMALADEAGESVCSANLLRAKVALLVVDFVEFASNIDLLGHEPIVL
jgi:hypothetical protein